MFENSEIKPEAIWKPLASVDKECFACGPENPHGLKMCFESNGGQIRSKVSMKQAFRGWSNLIHGGILSTMLDETMSWTVINFTRKFMLTRSMTVTFKKPVRVGAVITVTGYIKEQSSERNALVVAEIHDEDDDLCATAEGDFALFSKEHFLRMEIMPEEDIEAMASAISD